MIFKDKNASYSEEIEGKLSAFGDLGALPTSSLNEFLGRPVVLSTSSWAVGSALTLSYNPWTLFLAKTSISAKTQNFARLRGKMKIKVVINGNGFYYGRLVVSYLPFYGTNDQATLSRSLTAPVTDDFYEICQRPKIFIDPTTSQGAEMELPFFHYKDWYNLTGEDTPNLGELSITTLNDLQHANGGTADLTVTVFGWMEEAEICLPTTYVPTSQSARNGRSLPKRGMPNDEYTSDGAVSSSLDTVSNIADVLATVPVLAPFARATEAFTRVGADVAFLMGYSRPIEINNISRYRPEYYGNMVNTDQSDVAEKAAFSSKQEISIDSRVWGLNGHDEMTLPYVLSKDGFYGTFAWTTTNAVDDLLWNVGVCPDICSANGLEVHNTPLAYFGRLFRNWRGSIKYRFQVVASAFHKGRLRVTWDPRVFSGTADYNTVYTMILDIEKERDFEVVINWGEDVPYLVLTDSRTSTHFGTVALTANDAYNGILSVSVLNQLAAPSLSGLSININCFVQAGDNFEFQNPSFEKLNDLAFWNPTSQSVIDSVEVAANEEAQDTLQLTKSVDMNYPLQTYGEHIASLRSVLKRYCFSMALQGFNGISDRAIVYQFTVPDFPLNRGKDPNNPFSYVSGVTPVVMTPLNYVAPCYVARRGALRNLYSNLGFPTDYCDTWAIEREPAPAAYGLETVVISGTDAEVNQIAVCGSDNKVFRGWQGLTISPKERPVVALESPHMSPRKFFFARRLAAPIGSVDVQMGNSHKFYVTTVTTDLPTVNQRGMWARFVSTGEDFDLSFYLSTPILYVHSIVSA